MIVWKTNEMNYATVDLDGHLYDVHFRYFGNASYFIESVYELAAKTAQYNIVDDLSATFISLLVEELIVLEGK